MVKISLPPTGQMDPAILDRLQVSVTFDIETAQGLLDEVR